MRAIVVYESLWGNTAAIAKAIAEGIGEGAEALSTSQATPERVAAAELIVAGAPLLGFSLPTEDMRASIRSNPANPKGDFSSPAIRTWLAGLPKGSAGFATFETRIWWSPGSSAKSIAKELAALGYRQAAAPERFLVTGRFGPLKDGEIDRARAWGRTLARS